MAEATYRFRRSLRTDEQSFTVTDDVLIAVFGAVPLADIAEVRVLATPGLRSIYGVVAPAARSCTISCRDGRKIRLSSLHFLGFGRFEDRSATYVPFIRTLISNLRARSPGTRLLSGMPPTTWGCLTLFFVALSLGLAAIVVLGAIGLVMNHQVTVGSVLVLLALALIAIGPISYLLALRRSRPHSLDPDEI